ncbi:MAG: DUF2330 domain-containing protein [Verrucomicrobiales bacterium]|nr:DUF2330 domain-containing protein [Verrucomicrobiales bacterium]
MKISLAVFVLFGLTSLSLADGKLIRPANYSGSLEETSQEAIIIFHGGDEEKSATEDLILKIQVAGKTDDFAWVVPFPNPPKTAEESDRLFSELFSYVETRLRPPPKSKTLGAKVGAANGGENEADRKVEVISREVVGSYEVAVVKEKVAGSLNEWLEKEGYQPLENAEDVIGFYREKDYVFACIKVAETGLTKTKDGKVDLHPLRFTFETGGRDGIYFPMKMTGLQTEPFNVNLYVFYGAWLNDHINGYGYEHRGFSLKYRDWDTKQCKANAGKSWSLPERDPFLGNLAHRIPTVKKFFQKRHPGELFYLTNIQAKNLKPGDVRQWQDDLWIFPYYTDKKFVPFDAR